MICLVCRCHDMHACPLGCSWWTAELCTGCEIYVPDELETLETAARVIMATIVRGTKPTKEEAGLAFEVLVAILRAERRRKLRELRRENAGVPVDLLVEQLHEEHQRGMRMEAVA